MTLLTDADVEFFKLAGIAPCAPADLDIRAYKKPRQAPTRRTGDESLEDLGRQKIAARLATQSSQSYLPRGAGQFEILDEVLRNRFHKVGRQTPFYTRIRIERRAPHRGEMVLLRILRPRLWSGAELLVCLVERTVSTGGILVRSNPQTRATLRITGQELAASDGYVFEGVIVDGVVAQSPEVPS